MWSRLGVVGNYADALKLGAHVFSNLRCTCEEIAKLIKIIGRTGLNPCVQGIVF
jgi:hypothetical protein